LAVLIDPDNQPPEQAAEFAQNAENQGADLFFVGGSLVVSDQLDACIRAVKSVSQLPVVIFPGSPMQVSAEADGLLLISLISGRNPEMLIGHHVIAAPALKRAGLELLPTGYLLIDGGKPTTASFMSGTAPIPANKPEIAATTAMAGEMLGLRCIYLDAGSGAEQRVPNDMISSVRKTVDVPLIIGGGMRSPEDARAAAQAGANVVVVGNVLEHSPTMVAAFAAAVHG